MAENQLIFGLKRRYAQTLGLIAAGQDRTDDLAHLGAVIIMFNPAANLGAIEPIRPYRPNRVRWSRTALSILRGQNAPMTARALAKCVLTARGVPLVRANLKRVECSLHAVLARLESNGVVRAWGSPKRWRLETYSTPDTSDASRT